MTAEEMADQSTSFKVPPLNYVKSTVVESSESVLIGKEEEQVPYAS